MTPFGLSNDHDDDRLHEECGVFGIFGHSDAAALTTLGLHALQHRGQEAAGIVSFDGDQFHAEKHRRPDRRHVYPQGSLERLTGDRAIGHTRYSTTGGDELRNVQPFFAEFAGGGFAVAHNGNLTNAMTLQRAAADAMARSSTSTSDTEVILHLSRPARQAHFEERLVSALAQLEGAFSLVGITNKKMIGCRDPLGIRPLVLGDLDGAYILASETCALDIIGARLVRDIEPGEMVVIDRQGLKSSLPFEPRKIAVLHFRICLFRPARFGDRRAQRL